MLDCSLLNQNNYSHDSASCENLGTTLPALCARPRQVLSDSSVCTNKEHCNVCIFSHLHERGVGGLIGLRVVDHQVQQNLPVYWGTQTHRHQFRELGLHFWVQVNHLHVATTQSTPKGSKQREGVKSNRRYTLSTAHSCQNSTAPP